MPVTELSDYAWLVEDEAAAKYLAQIADDTRPALQRLDGLRRELSAERARLIVEQTQLRRRAMAKFGDAASQMFFTPLLLEQATDRWIGRYKAARLHAAARGAVVHDYCCGLGGDLLALASAGPAAGWDVSPLACLFAKTNLSATHNNPAHQQATVHQANVEQQTPPSTEPWHVDPDRRAAGKRSTTIDEHAPGPELIDRWLRTSPNGAVKLAPATEPPAAWENTCELEWITSRRECRQLVAWFGQLAHTPGQRRATIVSTDDDRPAKGVGSLLRLATPHQSQTPQSKKTPDPFYSVTATFTGEPDVPFAIAHEPLGYLYDPDPSILAAGLLGALADHHQLKSLGPGGAYLTGDAKMADLLLARFAIEACLPLRAPAVAQHLAARGVGRVEVKKRGVAVDPEKFRRELKLRGDCEATVILTRIDKRQVAIVAHRELECTAPI